MTPREKLLAAGLGGLILVFVVGVGGYLGVYLPIQTRNANTARIEADAAEKAKKLAQLKKDMGRLADATAKSLPADPDVARREYEAALGRLLVSAKVPRGYTVRPKSPDTRPVPEVGPKKPAYQRIAFEITMKKVDLATLTDFLERYYRLNLLHQITKLQIKRSDVESAAGGAKKAGTDRADLDVTVVTEAAILDGAEPRKSLLPVPAAIGAVASAAGLHHLGHSPELARGLAPHPADPVLAGTDRQYLAVLAKDPFHGPLPPPVYPAVTAEGVRIADGSEAPAAKFTVKLSAASGQTVTVDYATKDDSAVADRDYTATKGTLTFLPGETTKSVNVPLVGTETLSSDRTFLLTLAQPTGGATLRSEKAIATLAAAPPPPPKEDVSAFIKLTGITRRSDGSATADVKDAANNLDYQIDLRLLAGEPLVKVEKGYYIKDRRKIAEKGSELNISDDTSGTVRKFQVVGLDADGLVLTAEPEKPKAAAKPAPGGFGRPVGAAAKPVAAPVNPAVAVGGGAVVAVPKTSVFVWRVGQSLKMVKELPAAEGVQALARAKANWGRPAEEPTAAASVKQQTEPNGPAAVTID